MDLLEVRLTAAFNAWQVPLAQGGIRFPDMGRCAKMSGLLKTVKLSLERGFTSACLGSDPTLAI